MLRSGWKARERLRGCWGQKTTPIKERLQLLPVHSAAWLYNICRQRLMIKHQVLKINLSLFISSYTSFTSKAEGRRRPEEKGGGGRRWNCSLIARKRWEWESWPLFTSTFDDVIWNKSFPLPPGMDSRFWNKSSSCTHKHAHTALTAMDIKSIPHLSWFFFSLCDTNELYQAVLKHRSRKFRVGFIPIKCLVCIQVVHCNMCIRNLLFCVIFPPHITVWSRNRFEICPWRSEG